MLKLSLEAIEVIDAIDRTGSFSAASETLHKVPSTISYTVGKLEQQLGLGLFQRHGPRISLTPAGRELLAEGRWLLVAAADLENRIKRTATGFESELRICYDSIIPPQLLIPDIASFEEIGCGTRLRFADEVMTGTWEALRDGRADLCIAVGEGPAGGGFQARSMGLVEFIFCVSPQHPLAKARKPLQREDLLAHTAIVVADSARHLPPRTIGLLSGQNRITVPDVSAKITLQIAGIGHGFLPRVRVTEALARGELVEKAVREPRPAETMWLAWKQAETGEALRWWIDRLSERSLIRSQ